MASEKLEIHGRIRNAAVLYNISESLSYGIQLNYTR